MFVLHTTFAPVSPVIYTSPIIQGYYVPFSFGPTCSTLNVGSASFLARANTLLENSQTTQVDSPLLPRSSTKLVSTGLGSKDENNPTRDKLIELVDQMVAAGGYAQAAKAYAEISVKFGTTSELLTRRYVALILNGDFGQAEVLVQLSQALDQPINADKIPVSNVYQFLNAPLVIEARSEELAERAYRNQQDPIALLSVSQWLGLCGDLRRSELFAKRARVLQSKIGDAQDRQLPRDIASDRSNTLVSTQN